MGAGKQECSCDMLHLKYPSDIQKSDKEAIGNIRSQFVEKAGLEV